MTARGALAGGGVVAGPFFLAAAMIEGARRPDYDPVRHPINFAVTGSLYLAAAVRGPGNRLDRMALGLSGVALLASAVFRTDPVSG